MTHTAVAVLLIVTFVAGVAIGFLLGRAVHLERRERAATGEHGRIGVMRRILGWIVSAVQRPMVAATLLTIAFLLSATGAFLNARTSGRVGDVVQCIADYNRAEGQARDERAAASRTSTRSELRLWLRFREQIAATTTTTADFLVTIDHRIARLRDVLASQTAYPYPRPESCDDGKFNYDDAQEATS